MNIMTNIIDPSDLRETIDISDCPLFIPKEIITAQAPNNVTVKELVNMIDDLTGYIQQARLAQSKLTNKLNIFLSVT